MTSRKQVRRYISRLLSRKVGGGIQIYILIFFFMMFLLVLFRLVLDAQRLTITKDNVDDALVTSMVSACVYNKNEKNASGAVVIYRDVTPRFGARMTLTEGGREKADPQPADVLSMPELLDPLGDEYLQKSWDCFIRNFKQNLRLADDLTASISGIDGQIEIEEFSIYNKFYNLDHDRQQTDFMFVRYTYHPDSDAWSAYAYAPNTCPKAYNSLTKTESQIKESSISTKISFRVVAGTETSLTREIGRTQADYSIPVTYQRIVDIKLYIK